jgi:hypothetical protein
VWLRSPRFDRLRDVAGKALGTRPERPRIEERSFVGRADETLGRRADELAPLLKVRVVRVRSDDTRLGTRRRVVVRAEGLGPDLARYWRRLREIEDAVAARDQAGYWSGWSVRNLIRVLIDAFRS